MQSKQEQDTISIRHFEEISAKDIAIVGGKNASLGELYNALRPKGISVPGGFVITSFAYKDFLIQNRLETALFELFGRLDRENYSNLRAIGEKARALLLGAVLPPQLVNDIQAAYQQLCKEYGDHVSVAVRSSATAEDLPGASFAGQHESFLNIAGPEQLLQACKDCYISLFTDRAVKYREDHGFNQMKVFMSVGVQVMVRSDLAYSGVSFTLEPESGFRNIIHITSSWGLGENIVKGSVNPDEYYLYKPFLKNARRPLVSRKLGSKELTMIYGTKDPGSGTVNTETPIEKRRQFAMDNEMVLRVAEWSLLIEQHYGTPMDIEWAVDGITGSLFIVQARPETVHSRRTPYLISEYKLKGKGPLLLEGIAVGSRVASGNARVLSSPSEIDKINRGEVLVTRITNPDWDPVMKKAAALVTDQGGRTSHAAIVAREMGLTAVVGTLQATHKIKDGQQITISCAEGETGKVYEGALEWTELEIDFKNMRLPKTKAMMILGDPEQAYRLSFYPNHGVGLMRLEFVINNAIGIHPMALVHYADMKDQKVRQAIEAKTYLYANKEDYFTDKLSQAVGTIAAAFYPKDVIVRMSDFKTNEYANLVGGAQFEPEEQNPMLGFRGASRYYHERYKDGFRLECKAMKIVREEMGFTNVKLMIPFCRTPEEGRKVVELMKEFGLERGKDKLEIYVMAEIPSNVLSAEKFAMVFDGFSIGSNDLTQLTLGIDRDSALISSLFNENDEAARTMVSMMIEKAKKSGAKIGLCGQAPSDSPEFARFLVEQGIDSISFNPDALIRGIQNMQEAEKEIFRTIRKD